MTDRDDRYNASQKGKARAQRHESSDYRRGYQAGYKAGRRKAEALNPDTKEVSHE